MQTDLELRINPKTVRRQVEDRLREAIMDGRFAPGEHLAERQLCELFGVSRSVIREAMPMLEAEGLVVILPHRGPHVSFMSEIEVREVYEVRAAIEALAGRTFAERASDEEVVKLRAVFHELAGADSADRAQLFDIKRRYYDILLSGGRNSYLSRTMEQLLNRNRRIRSLSLSSPGRLPHTINELRKVVEAIERRDPEGAWNACIDHVRAAEAAAVPLLQEQDAKRINVERV